jgi:hypothetical protein
VVFTRTRPLNPARRRPINQEMKRLALVLLLALAGCGGTDAPITPHVKRQTLKFDPGVSPRDREWIESAIAGARPEAHELIDDVDGMVVIKTWSGANERAVGLTERTGESNYTVSFNVAYLDGERKLDRNTVVLHELGHVVDMALVPPTLRDQLAGELPSTGACYRSDSGDCTAPQERFADTFAKWALRGAVSAVGAGYSLATPASLEDWGAPLAHLAITIDVALSGGR